MDTRYALRCSPAFLPVAAQVLSQYSLAQFGPLAVILNVTLTHCLAIVVDEYGHEIMSMGPASPDEIDRLGAAMRRPHTVTHLMTPKSMTRILLLPLIFCTACLDQWLTAPPCHPTIIRERIPVTTFTLANDTVTSSHAYEVRTDTVCKQ